MLTSDVTSKIKALVMTDCEPLKQSDLDFVAPQYAQRVRALIDYWLGAKLSLFSSSPFSLLCECLNNQTLLRYSI